MRDIVGDLAQIAGQRADAIEHQVDGRADPRDLVAAGQARDAAVDLARADAPGLVGDRLHAAQHAPADEIAGRQAEQNDAQLRPQQGAEEGIPEVVELAWIAADQQAPAVRKIDRDRAQHAVRQPERPPARHPDPPPLGRDREVRKVPGQQLPIRGVQEVEIMAAQGRPRPFAPSSQAVPRGRRRRR